MSVFDHLTMEGKLSAIYEQLLSAETKHNDSLARMAATEDLVSQVLVIVEMIKSKVLTVGEFTPAPLIPIEPAKEEDGTPGQS